jgi:ATPase subunit of ABC transporter with duplicated ATPase domains
LVISHDRFFLDRICTHRPVLAGVSYVELLECSFVDCGADKLRRQGSGSVEPKRIRNNNIAR